MCPSFQARLLTDEQSVSAQENMKRFLMPLMPGQLNAHTQVTSRPGVTPKKIERTDQETPKEKVP